MNIMIENKKDFFISYTGKDEAWATWIAETLENNGYATIVQAWDFPSGGSFVNDMHEALKSCERVILAVTQNYFKSDNCNAEWQNVFVDDPIGEKGLIIPVRIENIDLEGILKARTYIDIYGCDAIEATKKLLDGVSIKPKERKSNGFPGKTVSFPDKLPPNNLPNRNLFFSGREDILQSLAVAFEKDNYITLTQAIAGLGGAGKTQIAIEYAYRHSNRYNCIWLFNAETVQTIKSSIEKFLESNNIIIETPEYIKEIFRNWTANNKRWLFIFDNAEDYNTLEDYLPQNHVGQGNVLVTSRNEFWSKTGNEILKVNPFIEKEAMMFLYKRIKNIKDDKNAKQLNILLGGLPLALEHAAAYILENNLSFSNYIELFNENKIRLLKEGLAECELSIDVTWNISIEKIAIESARQFLYLCAYYAPENIDINVLLLNNPYLPLPLKEEINDKLLFNRIIHELRHYSLITLTDKSINIHRLLQESIKYNIGKDMKYLKSCFQHIIDLMQQFDYSTKEERNVIRNILPHALYICDNIKSAEMQLDKYVICFEIAKIHFQFALYEEAKKYFYKTLTIVEKVMGVENIHAVVIYKSIAEVYNEQGDYVLALEWNGKALAIAEKILGIENSFAASIYNNMALVYQAQGDYSQAMEWFMKTLDIKEKVMGLENIETATTYNNIALLYQAQGDYKKALEWNYKSLEIRVKILGTENLDIAVTYNNIALVYQAQGDYSQAMEWFMKALTIGEKALDTEHPFIAKAYNNIAGVYKDQGDYSRAIEWSEKALKIAENILGKEHPFTAAIYNNIALVYQVQGDYPRAMEWFMKALAIAENKLGGEHPSTASSYSNIAEVYKAQGDFVKALEWNDKALAIVENRLGYEHPFTAVAYNNRASVYHAQDNYSDAMEWYMKALTIYEKVLGTEHPSTATIYNNIAGVYQILDDYSDAMEWYMKALEIIEKVLGTVHPSTANLYNNIAVVYQAQCDNSKAMEYYRKALRIFETKLGHNHPNVKIVRDNMNNLYRID